MARLRLAEVQLRRETEARAAAVGRYSDGANCALTTPSADRSADLDRDTVV